jgi:hypothetical protein
MSSTFLASASDARWQCCGSGISLQLELELELELEVPADACKGPGGGLEPKRPEPPLLSSPPSHTQLLRPVTVHKHRVQRDEAHTSCITIRLTRN